MKTLQPSLVLLLMILSCTHISEAQMGCWSKCFGYPPSDSFRLDDAKIVAWSQEDQRPGRADYRTASIPECAAFFAKGGEEKRSTFFVLRQISLTLSSPVVFCA